MNLIKKKINLTQELKELNKTLEKFEIEREIKKKNFFETILNEDLNLIKFSSDFLKNKRDVEKIEESNQHTILEQEIKFTKSINQENFCINKRLMLSASSTLCSLKTEEIEEDMITKNKLKKSTSDFNFFKRSSNSLDDISTCKLGSSDTLSSQSSSQSEIAIQELVQFQQLRMEKKIEREKYKDFLREKNLIYLKSISNLSEKNFDNADSSNDIPQENIDLPTVQSIQKEVLETEIDFILNEMVKCSDPLEDNPVEVENDEIIEAEVDNLQIANDKCTPINECIKFSVSLDKVILERELSKTISQLKNQTEVDNPNVNFSYSISDKVDTNENSDGEFMVESIEVVLKLKKKN